jgi:hypothetical protein
MLLTFLVTLACTLFLAAVMVGIRYRIETLMDQAESPESASVPVIAPREPELAR